MSEGRRAAAHEACRYVRQQLSGLADDEEDPPLVLGLGSGRTVELFIEALGELPGSERRRINGIPTSEATWQAAERAGLAVGVDEGHGSIDLAVDGADEIDPDLSLVKGGGGALFRERIVARSAREFVVIADEAKQVPRLGAFPLPVEISPFCIELTMVGVIDELLNLGYSLKPSRDITIRSIGGAGQRPFQTENGNRIIDMSLGEYRDLNELSAGLTIIPGVIAHGLFLGLADLAFIGAKDGTVRRVDAPGRAQVVH